MHHLILRILFLTAALIAENAHFTRAEAAGPLSHIYYANYWLKAQNIKLSDTDKSLFFKGTLFPDIRYLHVIRRADTHKKHVNLVTLKKMCLDDPFLCGMHLHAYVDDERAKFVNSYKISRHLRTIQKNIREAFLKFLEDELINGQVNVTKILFDLNSVDPQQLSFGVDAHDVKRWHRYLQAYLVQSPEASLNTLSHLSKPLFGLSPELVNKLAQHITLKKEQHVFQKYGEALQSRLQERLSHSH